MLPATMAVLGLPGPRPPDTHDIKKFPIEKDDVYDIDQDRPFKKLVVIGNTGAGKSTFCNRITDQLILSVSAEASGCTQSGTFSFKRNRQKTISLVNTIIKWKKNKADNIQKRDKHGGNQPTGKGEQDLVQEGLFSDLSDWQKMAGVQHSGDKTSCDTVELNTKHHSSITTTTTEENYVINQQTFHLPSEIMEADADQDLQNSANLKTTIPPQENLAGWLGEGQVMVGRPRLEEWQTSQEPKAGMIEASEDSPIGSKTSQGKFLQRKVGGLMIDYHEHINRVMQEGGWEGMKRLDDKLTKWADSEEEFRQEKRESVLALYSREDTSTESRDLATEACRRHRENRKRKKEEEQRELEDYYKQGAGLAVIVNQKIFPPGLQDMLGTDRDRDELKSTFTLFEGDVVVWDNLAAQVRQGFQDLVIRTCAVLDLVIRVMLVSSLVLMARREDEYKTRKTIESKENLKELVA